MAGRVSSGAWPVSIPRWVLLRAITAAEWNAAAPGNAVDIATIPSGAILADVFVKSSSDFNDSAPPILLILGWKLDDLTPRYLSTSQGAQLQVYPDDWAGVSGTESASHGGPFSNPTLYPYQAVIDSEYGLPAFVKDADVAGPLQFKVNGGAGDATTGTVEVWGLIQPEAF